MATRINAARCAVGDTGKDLASRSMAHSLPLPDKPSIAVLAFTNMSGDPGQDYFSDGITDDIIADLSRFSELLVIARNSTFQYKGKSVDIRQVGRELGVRYVLRAAFAAPATVSTSALSVSTPRPARPLGRPLRSQAR